MEGDVALNWGPWVYRMSTLGGPHNIARGILVLWSQADLGSHFDSTIHLLYFHPCKLGVTDPTWSSCIGGCSGVSCVSAWLMVQQMVVSSLYWHSPT